MSNLRLPIRFKAGLLNNLRNNKVKLLNEASFSYTELYGKQKYQPQWLDYINNN